MKRKIELPLLLSLVIVFLWVAVLTATETENLGIRVLPAPGKVVVDGNPNDWDLSAGVFTCGDVENRRQTMSTWFHAMYDASNLYILARWNDDTPLNNPGQTMTVCNSASSPIPMTRTSEPRIGPAGTDRMVAT